MALHSRDSIGSIIIDGFKSFAEEQRLEIRPLTLLAGANSSGKSSALQGVLLLKQTLEAPYDPGALLLDGPHVRFTSAGQILTRLPFCEVSEFRVGIESESGEAFVNRFRKEGYGFELVETSYFSAGQPEVRLTPGMSAAVLEEIIGDSFDLTGRELAVGRELCFLVIFERGFFEHTPVERFSGWPFEFFHLLRELIHVPGLRGSLERTYRTTAVGETFPGTFDNYTASVLLAWQASDNERRLRVDRDLQRLGLASKVEARQLNAAQLELLVGRVPFAESSADDLVNIADVGFGVSQALPVIVALQVAQAGQVVYIDQPELHLHPRAQQAMAMVLADAARRGVRVVVETHSSILLLAVQSLVAEGKLDPALVKLHWFQRDERGATQIHSTDLDENGAYGDWPEDFGDVRAEVENRYLNAVEARAFSRPAAKRARTKKK